MECKCKESPKGWTLEHFEASVLLKKQKLKNIDHDLEMWTFLLCRVCKRVLDSEKEQKVVFMQLTYAFIIFKFKTWKVVTISFRLLIF
jgi:hypothetical protein